MIIYHKVVYILYIYLMYKMKKTIIDYRYSKDKNHTMFW